MNKADLFFGTSGPYDAPIVLVGEAWGGDEALAQRPFVGSSGTELNRILSEAGLNRDDILCTNVVPERPQGNEMWRFFHPRSTPSGLQPIGGLDPRENVHFGLSSLYGQISAYPRRLVIAAGNYALWALSRGCCGVAAIRTSNGRPVPPDLCTNGPTGIGNWRGSMWFVEPPSGLTLNGSGNETRRPLENQCDGLSGTSPRIPLLPIVHPAAILRDWPQRAVTVHDLRARVVMALRGNWRHREPPVFLAPPTFRDAVSTLRLWLARADDPTIGAGLDLACDIETSCGLITCIGFADSPMFAMSIPLIARTPLNGFDSWWPPDEEATIIHLIRRLFAHPRVRIAGQNFIYDTQYIQHWFGCTPRLDFDTMLAQNVLFPGTPKALDYLSSLYCEYHWFWKEDAKEWNGHGSINDLLAYNAWDCVRTWEIAREQRQLLTDDRPSPAAFSLREQMDVKMRTNDLCLRMMNRGIRIDSQRRANLTIECSNALTRLYADLERIIPQSWVDPEGFAELEARRRGERAWRKADDRYVMWYRSPKQTKFVLHDILGLPSITSRKTGSVTTGKEARAELAAKYPEWTGLLRRLGLAESIDNTRGVLSAGVDPDGRMRCSFNPAGTETHRLSSSKNAFGRGTNLQNLTVGKEDE